MAQDEGQWTRRRFLGSAILTGTALSGSVARRAQTPSTAAELDETTIDELQRSLESGEWTARRLAEYYLERIDSIDRQGPTLRSILETNPDALELADELDEERRERGPRGPLHGIPVFLKDNVATADRMTTTAGSLALDGSIPSEDSFVAAQLRRAGALLLAKTNLSEWANFRSSHSSSGWSGRGGQCKNPYALNRNPCGSSSGTGAAISANLGAVGIGTETDGSVVCPSNANGLVGIKPTVGLVSRAGIIPIAHSQDTAGPMTRTVKDAAIVLGALTGIDPNDGATAASRGGSESNYTRFLDPRGLSGARVGVARQFFGFHPDVDRVLEEALAEMRRQGATLIDPVELVPSEHYDQSEWTVLLYEFKADLNRYLASLGPSAPVSSPRAVIDFNKGHPDLEMPFFGQGIFHLAQAKGPLTEQEYLSALAKNHRLTRSEGIDAVVAKHRLDTIVAPSGGPAWVTDLVNGDHFSGSSSSPAAVSGYPNITVPAVSVHGLPIGLSFFGVAWSERRLLKLAYASSRQRLRGASQRSDGRSRTLVD